MNLLEYVFLNYPVYLALGEATRADERLKLLLKLRSVNKSLQKIIDTWDLWWTWWKLPTLFFDDYDPLHRFMCRLCISYLDTAGNASVDQMYRQRLFGIARLKTIQRAVQAHSFSTLLCFRRAPIFFVCPLFVHLLHQMLSIHKIPKVDNQVKRRKLINHGFLSEDQKQQTLRIFRFCQKLIRRMTVHYGCCRHDKTRFTCALRFLENAPVKQEVAFK